MFKKYKSSMMVSATFLYISQSVGIYNVLKLQFCIKGKKKEKNVWRCKKKLKNILKDLSIKMFWLIIGFLLLNQIYSPIQFRIIIVYNNIWNLFFAILFYVFTHFSINFFLWRKITTLKDDNAYSMTSTNFSGFGR